MGIWPNGWLDIEASLGPSSLIHVGLVGREPIFISLRQALPKQHRALTLHWPPCRPRVCLCVVSAVASGAGSMAQPPDCQGVGREAEESLVLLALECARVIMREPALRPLNLSIFNYQCPRRRLKAA